jgi:nucleotide-binding universal stress UspA family protein
MKVLLAYDGREHSKPALEEVDRLAAGNGGAEVTVLSVVSTADAPSRFATGHMPHAQEDATEAHAFLREQGIEAAVKVDSGDPAEIIVREARDGAYDVVVTGTRSRGPVARFLLGSVSHRVVDEAPCKVIVAGHDHRVKVERREPTA